MNRTAALAVPAVAGLLSLSGCGSRPDYQEAELADVLAHRAPAPLERYLIDRPPVVAVRRNTGIIRDGSLFAILVGPDLKANLESHPKGRFGVRWVRDPSVHLVLERIYSGKEFVDLLEGKDGFRFHFPRLVPPSEVAFDDYPEASPESLVDRSGPAHLSDAPLGFEPCGEGAVGWAAGMFPGLRPERDTYQLGPPEARFVVATRDPMTLLMLDFLRSEKRPFSGGVAVAAVVPRAERARAGVAGAVDVRWIHLGGSLYFVVP